MERSLPADDLRSLVMAAFPKKHALVVEELASKHGITTKEELLRVLSADTQSIHTITDAWRSRLTTALITEAAVRSVLLLPHDVSSWPDFGGVVKVGWRPNRDADGPTLLVMQGDLTRCRADAVVNPANSQLTHGGGLAAAIVKKGGVAIQKESDKWIKHNGMVEVGAAMSTTAGKLPCKRVIHTVGPKIGRKRLPTDEEASQLRQAVRSALVECTRLGLTSVAVPGISTGSFRYPVELGATEIVKECVHFCRVEPTTPVQMILLMNIDDITVSGFAKALEDAAKIDISAKA